MPCSVTQPAPKATGNKSKFDDLADQIPPHIRKRVIDDLDELIMTGRFVAAPFNSDADTPGAGAVEFPGGNRIHIRIGLPVKNLHLDAEQCRAWYVQIV